MPDWLGWVIAVVVEDPVLGRIITAVVFLLIAACILAKLLYEVAAGAMGIFFRWVFRCPAKSPGPIQ